MSGPAELLAEPVLVLRPGDGRMTESAYALTNGEGHVLATGREPSLGVAGQVIRLASKSYRDFRRTVRFSAPDGTPLFTVDKLRYSHTRRTQVLDGRGNRVGRIDDASPVLSKRFRLLDADERAVGLAEGERGELAITAAAGGQVGELRWGGWQDRFWTLRADGPVPEPLKLMMIAAMVLSELTRGR